MSAAGGPESWPDNPVLVEVRRSGFLESVHRGSLVVLDAEGAVSFAAGAPDRPTLPRSSNKPVQATAMLAAGWRPGSTRELAIGAGSHNGEDDHRGTVARILSSAGLGPDDLGCPPALPLDEATRAGWLMVGRAPERLAMSCSGKHAGMLAACVAAGWSTSGYLERDHPLQRAIEARLSEAAGEPVTAVVVDGCGAPQHALSVTGLARSVLSLVQAPEGGGDRSVADAMRAEPWFVAGSAHEDTGLMTALPGLLAKYGADGVHVAAIPGRGAVALKMDDGGERGRTPALCAGLLRLGVEPAVLAPWLRVPVTGGDGVVGDVRPSELLAA